MNHQARITQQSIKPPKAVGLDGWQMVHNPQTFIVLWDEVDPSCLVHDGWTIHGTDLRAMAAKTPKRKKAPA